MKITMDFDKLEGFLRKLDTLHTNEALLNCRPILKQALLSKVFTTHGDTKKIESKQELQQLIRGGSDHNPATARDGAPYKSDPEYTKRKGHSVPHKFENFGFWRNISVKVARNRLKMEIKDRKTKKGFDYLTYHENTRSVLKRAFHEAWADMIDEIIKTYTGCAKK